MLPASLAQSDFVDYELTTSDAELTYLLQSWYDAGYATGRYEVWKSIAHNSRLCMEDLMHHKNGNNQMKKHK